MTNVVLGARQYNNAISSYFEGKLAHATIYSRALTQAEITRNYNYLKGYLRANRGIALA
ncbi:MAG: hypothetical protein BWY93_01462 [Euryarchaeota archaeon ADurb.BinA087]|nr:MAG: hypothetical protein BWY93_01462 [Euryarchaeota archaeon ADurb.BinA087]